MEYFLAKRESKFNEDNNNALEFTETVRSWQICGELSLLLEEANALLHIYSIRPITITVDLKRMSSKRLSKNMQMIVVKM